MSDQNTRADALLNVPFTVTQRQVNKFVGWTAIALPVVLFAVAFVPAVCRMSSISHFYYTPFGGDFLVGGLSVIGAILLLFYRYKGDSSEMNPAHSWWNALLAKVAGACALGVAFVPTSGLGCKYDGVVASRFFVPSTSFDVKTGPLSIYNETAFAKSAETDGDLSFRFWEVLGIGPDLAEKLGYIHYVSAAVMFLILGYFSYFVFTKVQTDDARNATGGETEVKKDRNRIYRIAGVVIFASIAALIVKFGLERFVLEGDRLEAFRETWNGYHLTFLFEALGLIAFGVSWLLKARIFGLYEDEVQDASASLAT